MMTKSKSKTSDRSVRPTRATADSSPGYRPIRNDKVLSPTRELFIREDDFGMEQGAGYAGGDGDEIALSVEDFDLAGAGEFREVNGAAIADAGGGGVVGGDGGELGQELAGVDEEVLHAVASACLNARFQSVKLRVQNSRFLHSASLSLRESEAPVGMTSSCLNFQLLLIPRDSLNFLDGVGMRDVEFGDGGAAEGFEMGSAAEELAHFVGDGAHVGSGGDAGAEAGAVGVDGKDDEFFDLDLDRLEDYLFIFSCQLVGGDAVDFLGGEWRWSLLNEAVEFGGELLESVQVKIGPSARWTAGGGCSHIASGGRLCSPHMI